MRRLQWLVIIGVLGSAGFSDCGGESDAPQSTGGGGSGGGGSGGSLGSGAATHGVGAWTTSSDGSESTSSGDSSGCYSITDCPEITCVCDGIPTLYLCEGSCSDASDECLDGTIAKSENCRLAPDGVGGGGSGGGGGEGGESGGVVCGSSDSRCVDYTHHECDVCEEGSCTEDQECYAMWECQKYWDACPSYFQCVMAASTCDGIMACEPCSGD